MKEKVLNGKKNGMLVLILCILAEIISIAFFAWSVSRVEMNESALNVILTIAGIVLMCTVWIPLIGLTFSPVKGPEGNIEFLGHLTLDDVPGIRPDTAEVVRQAHATLDK